MAAWNGDLVYQEGGKQIQEVDNGEQWFIFQTETRRNHMTIWVIFGHEFNG
jgi:hypothetical protein